MIRRKVNKNLMNLSMKLDEHLRREITTSIRFFGQVDKTTLVEQVRRKCLYQRIDITSEQIQRVLEGMIDT